LVVAWHWTPCDRRLGLSRPGGRSGRRADASSMIQAGTGADSPMTCGGSGVTGPVWAGDPERSCLLVRGREGQIVVEETADHAPDHRFELRGRVHIVEAEELGIATRGQGVELLPRVG